MVDTPKPEMGKATTPPPGKKPGPGLPDEADGDGKAKKPMMKPAPSSGRSIGRAIIVASVLLTIAWVYAAATSPRFVLAPAGTQENTFMYRLDQRTGAVHFCGTQQCTELPVRGAQ
ncbi:MAG: hypothetical protein SFV19_15020 [Rhodospirillaceae bacterium]|nr:hypothetical protein [Rhodospirillaceae bacterium]